MNFMGIGTGELIVILIIGVLVVGPDKMVELASKLGRLFVQLRKMTDGATHEFRDALAIDEIKDVIRGVTDEVKDIGREVQGTADDVAAISTDAQGAVQDIQKVAEGKSEPPPKPTPTGTIPQAVLDILGPATQTVTNNGLSSSSFLPREHVQVDVEVEPVVVPETKVAVDDQDEEPIELEDVIVEETLIDSRQATTESAS
ncbi:MAG: twin-arginine translocase TatA/TatE family subunit [Anaerolineae bacterium]